MGILTGMPHQPAAVFLGIAALLTSTGLLVAAVPAMRVDTASEPVSLAVDVDCPYAKFIIVSEPVA